MTDTLEQAVAAHRANKLHEAEVLYRAALAEDPNRADAHYNLGTIYGMWGRDADALREFLLATTVKPDFSEAWFMLCEFADKAGQQDLNLTAGENAVRLMPSMARAWLRYGIALSRLERDEEAIKAYTRAVELDPALVGAWANLAFSSKSVGHPREAEAAIRKAIEVAGQTLDTGEDAEAEYSFLHWHLALIELLFDRYKEGFAFFRARFKGGTNWRREAYPLWKDENLRGKTILVTAEQGHGDVIMLARYLPLLKAQGARVIFQPHPALVRLFTGWEGADDVIPFGTPVASAFDLHAPVFDLPYRFGTTLETIPEPGIPALKPDDKTHIDGDGRRKITVIWAGQPDNIRGRNRSVPLAQFAEIFSGTNAQFFSLTRDLRANEGDLLKTLPVIDLAPRIEDFADSARFIAQCDLVITCDSGTAHLAGGMGKPTFLMLPFVADWRWGLERDSCPWYPSMRLFRQTRRDEWGDVIAAVKAAIQKT